MSFFSSALSTFMTDEKNEHWINIILHKVMDSQSSTLSSTSTVPEDLLENQDDDYVREINVVDRIYFGNVEIFNLREKGPENDD
ncbi:hypothetical protein KUTeg_005698 [Tegillarca granosa]|uniref:Uncharacterized protein n=1 Tax=Tegillarca granosa TaxID=220873 RepID=A0ABQ9FLF3_TEGGR|nr:hypothetical protein KUTeg_005698 [Tegillarca granosa]